MNFFKKKEKQEIAWHPDFKDEAILPDIKVVRTGFIVNFTAASFACFFFIYYFIIMLQLAGTGSEVKQLKNFIDTNKAKSAELVIKNAEFIKNSGKLKEVQAFFKDYVNPSKYLVLLSNNSVKNSFFDEVRLTEKDVTIDNSKDKKKTLEHFYILTVLGTIEGEYTKALDSVEDFMERFKNIPEVQGELQDIEAISLKRDPKLNLFTYQIDITLKSKA